MIGGIMIENASRRHSGSETRQRSHLVQVRCTVEEHAQFQAAAERAGLSVGAYLRHQGIGATGPRAARRPPIERTLLAQLLGELGKCGSNVNQIARTLNTGGDEPPWLSRVMDEMHATAAAIRRAMGKAA